MAQIKSQFGTGKSLIVSFVGCRVKEIHPNNQLFLQNKFSFERLMFIENILLSEGSVNRFCHTTDPNSFFAFRKLANFIERRGSPCVLNYARLFEPTYFSKVA